MAKEYFVDTMILRDNRMLKVTLSDDKRIAIHMFKSEHTVEPGDGFYLDKTGTAMFLSIMFEVFRAYFRLMMKGGKE